MYQSVKRHNSHVFIIFHLTVYTYLTVIYLGYGKNFVVSFRNYLSSVVHCTAGGLQV